MSNTKTPYYDKKILRERITSYLQQLDPGKSIMSAAISAAIRHDFNFENVVKLCRDQYYDNKEGMISVVGEVPMLLILKYYENAQRRNQTRSNPTAI